MRMVTFFFVVYINVFLDTIISIETVLFVNNLIRKKNYRSAKTDIDQFKCKKEIYRVLLGSVNMVNQWLIMNHSIFVGCFKAITKIEYDSSKYMHNLNLQIDMIDSPPT